MMWRCAVLALCVFVSWCEAQQRTPLIINGSPSDAFPAVGIVGEQSVGGFCTGTLISPNHVLTAAHCGEAILAFGSAQSGTFTVGGRTYVTADVRIMPSYDARIFTDDLAILVLRDAVADVDPMEISFAPPSENAEVTLVGFGGQGTPMAGSDGSFGEQLVGMTRIDTVSDFEISWTFDEETESNPAPGDSGGPVLLDLGDGYVIVGVVSSGTTQNAGLGDKTFSMRVDAYADFIIAAVETPVDDPAPPIDPDGGETPADPLPEPEEPATQPEEPATEVEVPATEEDKPATEAGEPPAEMEDDTESPPTTTPTPGPEAENDQPETEAPETPTSEDDADDAVCHRPAHPGTKGETHKNRGQHRGHHRFGSGRRHSERRPSASQRAASRKHAQSRKVSSTSPQFEKYQSRKSSVRRLN